MTAAADQSLVDPSQCPLCGRPNQRPLRTAPAHEDPCWCMNTVIPGGLLARVPAHLRNKACICQSCVIEFQREAMIGLVGQPSRLP
jgi:hypothetical protein